MSPENRLRVDRLTRLRDLPELLTIQEFRDFLGISRTSAYELVRTGEVPCKRFGRRIFVPKQVLTSGTMDDSKEHR